MVFERFTPMARRVVMAAQEAARRRRRRRLGTEDLLAGLAEADGAPSSQALASLGVTVADIDIRVKRGGWRASPGHIPLAADARFAIEAAVREADIHGEVQVGSSHLLLGLVAERHGDGGRIISELALTYQSVRAALEAVAEPESPIPHREIVARANELAAQEQVMPPPGAAGESDGSCQRGPQA